MKQWFKNLFISFQVNRIGEVHDLKVAYDQGYHAAVWGYLVDPVTMHRSRDMLMGVGTTKRQALFGTSKPATIEKIQRFMQGVGFIPTSPLMVYEGEGWYPFTSHEVRTLCQRDLQRAEERYAADNRLSSIYLENRPSDFHVTG